MSLTRSISPSLPSVIVQGGKLVILSSAGRPRGFFYELLQNPNAETWIYASADQRQPARQQGHARLPEAALGLVSPIAARRELENEFAEDGESLLPPGLIDVAIDERLGEYPRSSLPAYCVLRLEPQEGLDQQGRWSCATRRGGPEAADHLVVRIDSHLEPEAVSRWWRRPSTRCAPTCARCLAASLVLNVSWSTKARRPGPC